MDKWAIGLSSWIIQDGNYGDFETGQRAKFAVEFYLFEFTLSKSTKCTIAVLEPSKYNVIAKVVFKAKDVWVLDLGDLLVYREEKPPNDVQVGQYLHGDLWLGVDPFFYFEYLNEIKGIPPLIYEWEIEQIEMQTAPFIESTDKAGEKILIRDPQKIGYRTIKATNAWKDDDTYGEYILHCRRLPTEPTR